MRLKKIFIIAAISLAVAAALFFVFKLFFVEEEPYLENGGGFDQEFLSSQISPISDRSVLGVAIKGDKVLYYSQSDGQVYQSDFSGNNLEKISDSLLPGLVKVSWSPSKDKVISTVQLNHFSEKYFYNYQTDYSKLLNHNIRCLDWSPDGNKIVYQYYNPQSGVNNISIADPDGANWKNVFELRMENLIIEWIKSDEVLFTNKPTSKEAGDAYLLNIKNKELKRIIKDKFGLAVLVSPKGDKLLFSETDNQGQESRLKVADLKDGSVQQLNFFTLPEKCVWSQDNRNLFCAVPRAIPETAKLPDDYHQDKIVFKDNFWKINLDTQEIVELYQAKDSDSQFYDAQDLNLPIMEDYLIFVNKRDGLLYSLDL